jgi:RHS repeat-associated protein
MAAMRLGGEKPHQGVLGKNPALNQGHEACNFTVLLGLRGQAELNRVGPRSTGKERDTESGNDYFGARYYASSMGRFMSPDDPFVDQNPSDPQSWNLYAYVRNNPLVNVDDDGHDCIYGNGDGSGYILRGDCRSDTDDGVFVDGTVDANSFQYNAANNSSSFSYISSSGALGLGVLQGPNLTNGFDPGSLAAGAFGPANNSTWNNASGTVDAAFNVEASIMAPWAVAGAQCTTGQSRGACAANLAISVLPEVSQLRAGATLLRAARGLNAAEILEKAGGFAQATKDFEALNGAEKALGNVKIKTLSDGSTAVLRNFSGDGRATLEIQNATGTTKFRYNP